MPTATPPLAGAVPGRLALWVGPEPTVNRVGDTWFDQLEATGFAHRLDDLDRLASLGAERIRFPLLWERTAPDDPARLDWRWSDERLARLRDLGLAPIAGLVHHGSGPRYTDLADPAFPDKLAHYAGEVARRYPWIDAWTPVNEPVTTARFAGLYGLWHPHQRSGAAFARMLVHQVLGTQRAMRAIRDVHPGAILVQTDDLGHTRSTAPLRYQARHDNARRWLGFDLLTGRVDDRHPFHRVLLDQGVPADALDALLAAPCPPDIVGINAYVTSERFLDHRLQRYPPHAHGGNGRHAYADVEAVRACGSPPGGFAARIAEAHARYGLPIALTEVHLGCTREEQLRWLEEARCAAVQARERGVDVRAVTAWSAFGAVDWDTLLTQANGRYEPGLWDVRAGVPRATALVDACRRIAQGLPPDHPVLAGPGWWRRPGRLAYAPYGRVRGRHGAGRPLLVAGATGTLGRAFARVCERRGIAYRLLSRAELDITDGKSVAVALGRWRPWALVNAAGYVRVDDAEDDERQWRENALGPALLAAACARRGVAFVTYSSDLVFDGAKAMPYVESDAANPLNAYGRAKHSAETTVLAAHPGALVIRTAAFFGPWDPHNFVAHALDRLRRGLPWDAAHDQQVSPTYVPHLVDASLDLLIDGEQGLWHVANHGAASWAELACEAARRAHLDASLVRAVSTASLGLAAARPRFTVLRSERGLAMPSLDEALDAFVREATGAAPVAAPDHAG
ncbi:MAG TPA: family 1 glycosylhydrolase [Casimicrobiaceae bacterium]|nr:family 1 glycosylhydrolase [Casimicrobiaceae bacterium]